MLAQRRKDKIKAMFITMRIGWKRKHDCAITLGGAE
jgi:hypothetical protein